MQSIFKNIIRSNYLNYSKYTVYRNVNSLCMNTKSSDYKSKEHNRKGRQVTKYALLTASAYLGYHLFKNKSLLPAVEAAEPVSGLFGRRKLYNFISDVVEQSAPAVVYIEIKDMGRVDFFTGRPMTTSNGSGFIIKEDGLILTNAHVVVNKPRSKVEVRLNSGETYTGVVEAVDLNSDLALVRIPVKNLPTMKLGNSSDMRAGEFVVAIGSPLSLSNSCTSGVISSTHRGSAELGLRNKEMVYIQTDAAITFGNSGGPLVNLDGEAIGVNSMKVTAGISFAIPIDYVKSFLAQNKGARQTSAIARKKYMGITMLTLTPQILHELHERQHPIPNDVRHGILVWKVIIGSPAYVGGLQPGDIVTHINGEPVTHVNDIYSYLGQTKKQTLQLMVIRLGQRFEVSITPEDST